MSDKGNDIDNLFNDGLKGFNPDAPKGVWGKLSEGLKGERHFHPVDDLFYDRLAANEAKPPLTVWGRIRNGLGNAMDAGMQNSLEGFEPTPPNWIWQSLSYMLLLDRRNRQRRRAFVAAGAMGVLALIGIVQWGLYHTMPEFAVNESSEVHKLKVVKVEPIDSRQSAVGSNSMDFNKAKDNQMLALGGEGLNKVGSNSAITKGHTQKLQAFQSSSPITPLQASRLESATDPQSDFNPVSVTPIIRSLELANLNYPMVSPEQMQMPEWKKPAPKAKPVSPWSFAVLGSVDHSFHSLKGAPGNEYMRIRNNSEQAKTTVSMNVRFKYSLSNHLSVSSGISMVQRGEKAEYNFRTQQEAQTMIQQLDKSTGKYFSVPYKYTFTRDHIQNAENRYTYLEIPMNIGYRFDLCCFSVQPSVGLSAGWLTAAKGTNLSMELNPSLVSLEDMKKQSMNRLNIGQSISVAVSVPLSKNLKLVTEPFYNRSLNNSLRNNMGVQQYFHSKGIMAGLEWKL